MGVNYQTVLWNRQKRIYDGIMLGLMALYLVCFVVFNKLFQPQITPETLLIRSTATLAFLMLHIILMIGPLCRLNPNFLPLLYNRRHLGVATFVVAAVHGIFSIIQFHALGDINPLLSLFIGNTQFGSLSSFPFQPLGFFALIILFLMAATSHDFWLHNLGPRFWKTMHTMVYVAYALIIMHVMLGVIQMEQSPTLVTLLAIGMLTIISLHLAAGLKQKKLDNTPVTSVEKGFYAVCDLNDIQNNRAKMVNVEGESIAIFKYDGQLSAVNNVCKHQNGPLGEGKIIDGCITCPWHGYQYLPENGQSPPPFTEKLATYDVLVQGTTVWVNPKPYPEGTRRAPCVF